MTLRAAVVQFEHAPADKAANFARIELFARRAKEQGVELCAFPECCISGYWFMRNLSLAGLRELAEAVPDGPSTQRLLALAKELDMTIGAGLVESDGERMFNTYVVAMPDGRFARHRKINSFEHEHISPGDAYTVFDLPNGTKCGILICYDNNLVENVRITALMGAEVGSPGTELEFAL